ncbi:MAG TPA: TonB-dependent receptor [Steroidobacteraceae bacterium]|nr:TonB-dependent receptor [Steroidobacteraceae bacterium]
MSARRMGSVTVYMRIARIAGPAVLAVLAGAGAAAQDAPGDAVLEEVTTVARKVQERLIDVPLAITKFDTQEIERAGIRNLDDVAALTPSLTFSNVIGEFLPVPVIRNMAPTAIFQENNAGIFVDGVFVSGREGLNFAQLDLSGIEVVKGPVSALYGRSTFSGAIIYTTARPTDTFTGRAEAQFGTDDKQFGKITLSGPIAGDRLQGRVALMYDNWEGSYTNHGGGDRLGGYEYKTVNASLLFTPSDSFEALLGLYASDDQIGTPALTSVATNCENRSLVNPMASGFANFCGELPEAGDLSTIPQAEGEDRDLVRSHLNLTWNLAGGSAIASVTGYSSLQQSFTEDASRSGPATFTYQATPFAPMAPGLLRTLQTGLLQIGPGDETQEFSQELRFTSALESSLRFSLGGYYYSTENEAAGDGVVSTQPLPADFFAFCPCVQTGPTTVVSLGFANPIYLPWFSSPTGDAILSPIVRDETEALAGFGYLEADFGQRWEGRLEARYTEEEKTVTDLLGDSPEQNNTWSFLTWRANLNYKPDEDTTVYGSVATGEKSGAFDTASVDFDGAGGAPPELLVFNVDPEKNTTFELGWKDRSRSGRLQSDLAVFYIDWTDIVIPQVITEVEGQVVNIPFSLDVNAGDATIYGIELAVVAQLSEGWVAEINGSWADAEYDDAVAETFREFPSFAPDGDVSGRKVLRQSKWKGALSLTYAAALNDRVDWFMRGDLTHQDQQYADSTNQTIIPSHTGFNARFGFQGERYQLELWALNLFEDDGPTGAFRDVRFDNSVSTSPALVGSVFPFRYTVSHPRLRQLGMTLRVNF